jgi:hypothetical protein
MSTLPCNESVHLQTRPYILGSAQKYWTSFTFIHLMKDNEKLDSYSMVAFISYGKPMPLELS